MRRGSWSKEEDEILTNYVNLHGHGKWRRIANNAGLKRSGKSCRLRWMNYLSPDIKRGDITVDEEDLIIRLHRLLGNRWSLIAGRLPGRTDNEIKNYWNTTLKKKYNMSHFSSRSNNKTMIIKSGEVTTETREDTQKAVASALVDNNNRDKMVSNLDSSLPVVVSPKGGDQLDTNHKVIPSVDGMILLPSEKDFNLLADIGDTGFGCLARDLVVPELDNVLEYSLAQGSISWEDDAKLFDVEFNKELNKLASFLDIDHED